MLSTPRHATIAAQATTTNGQRARISIGRLITPVTSRLGSVMRRNGRSNPVSEHKANGQNGEGKSRESVTWKDLWLPRLLAWLIMVQCNIFMAKGSAEPNKRVQKASAAPTTIASRCLCALRRCRCPWSGTNSLATSVRFVLCR